MIPNTKFSESFESLLAQSIQKLSCVIGIFDSFTLVNKHSATIFFSIEEKTLNLFPNFSFANSRLFSFSFDFSSDFFDYFSNGFSIGFSTSFSTNKIYASHYVIVQFNYLI